MATTAAHTKTKKAAPKKQRTSDVAAAKKVATAVAKKVKKSHGVGGILSAVLVPVATVAIGYGLAKYYGINVPSKVLSLVK